MTATVWNEEPQTLATRRQVLIGGALLASAATSFAMLPRKHEMLLGTGKLETLVPKTIGDWQFEASSGLVVPPQDQLRDEIYSQLVTRVYTARGQLPIMLLIAYSGSQDGTLQVHRPEVCYPASGFRLTTVEDHMVPLAGGPSVPSRYIIAESDLRREQMIYWTRLGHSFPRRWSEQRLAVMEENLAGIIPDGVLVRISTVAAGDARPMLDGFAATLYRAVNAQMKAVLTGAR